MVVSMPLASDPLHTRVFMNNSLTVQDSLVRQSTTIFSKFSFLPQLKSFVCKLCDYHTLLGQHKIVLSSLHFSHGKCRKRLQIALWAPCRPKAAAQKVQKFLVLVHPLVHTQNVHPSFSPCLPLCSHLGNQTQSQCPTANFNTHAQPNHQ